MTALRLALIGIYTLVLGTLGIVICIVRPGGRALMPLARFWSWLVLRTCRVRTRTIYEAGLDPSVPCVYVANHQSQLDIPALVLGMPVDFRIVAKRSLAYIPVFGWVLWLAGFVFIERRDRRRAIRAMDRAAEKIRRGTSIAVFAEGTRTRDGALLPFKKGAFVLALQAGVPVVPVALRGGFELLPRGRLRVRPGTIEMIFGAPVATDRYGMESKDELIGAVRDTIAAALRRTSA